MLLRPGLCHGANLSLNQGCAAAHATVNWTFRCAAEKDLDHGTLYLTDRTVNARIILRPLGWRDTSFQVTADKDRKVRRGRPFQRTGSETRPQDMGPR